ncbi:VOC family protein [Aquamicrobium sp. LC103]|uniref:VOC family protein n=1 Tax=Aquamicrobium sp. LC103 TaxID=1120658 RepID=UPI00063E7452|nr:VOC family protein [Aquamicrobium sp. LC103]TKT79103.1 glyoxalase [Aquamicrobium sp. LC103]
MPDFKPIEPPRIYATFRFRDAARMIDWLGEAFGFTVRASYKDDKGTVQHAELAFGSSIIMVGQAREDEYGDIVGGPAATGGKSLYIAVDDADALYRRASAAGATIEEELVDRDYGSREFICRDPEGNVWCFGTYWPKADEKP